MFYQMLQWGKNDKIFYQLLHLRGTELYMKIWPQTNREKCARIFLWDIFTNYCIYLAMFET